MYIVFKSDSSVTGRGFSASLYQMPGGCGGRMTAPNGYIYSPNYPNNYNHSEDCQWLISVDRNHVVDLQFLDFNVERHINCSYDYLAVSWVKYFASFCDCK